VHVEEPSYALLACIEALEALSLVDAMREASGFRAFILGCGFGGAKAGSIYRLDFACAIV